MTETHGTIEAVWRIESPRLIAGLAHMVHDVVLAEDLAQDALVAAMEQWPQSGIPENPGAWLMATAKHRAIDQFRRRELLDRKHQELGRDASARELQIPNFDTALDDHIGDDLLRLVFVACHPVLSTEARTALTLRMLGGLTTEEIARAFLVPESTIAQRIVRAKRTLSEKQVPFEVPRGTELAARLSSVLEVIYLVFNEGYSATAGDDWPEAHGLIALMEIQASRLKARVGPSGEPILLLDQNRAQWDQLLIRRGLAAIERARKLGASSGAYLLQAEIAACHARAREADETDWRRIAELYAELARVTPSPIVELNRAVAVGMAFGAGAGLEIADQLLEEPALKNYHLLPAVRGDLLEKLGRSGEARIEFEQAASLARNLRERNLLLNRASACARDASSA
jgi:RNA polymerase sigma factor (sigma-70 family)